MEKISGRFVAVTSREGRLQVKLFYEVNNGLEYPDTMRCKTLEFIGQTIQSAAKTLDRFFQRGCHVMWENETLLVTSTYLDEFPYVFDMILDAEEPEQAFLSHEAMGV
jgi:hypothetical protein